MKQFAKSLTLNNYSVAIVGTNNFFGQASYDIDERGYVMMKHGDKYRLRLKNNTGTRCNARVIVDGNNVGTWRIQPHSECTIERPSDIDKKFTFFVAGSSEAKQAGISSGNSDNGLVQVTFIPESLATMKTVHYNYENKGRFYHKCSDPENSCLSCSGNTRSLREKYDLTASTVQNTRGTTWFESPSQSFGVAGGTGLQGKSLQRFGVADDMNLDNMNTTTISLRLVGRVSTDASKITPLSSRVPMKRQTRVPPPV